MSASNAQHAQLTHPLSESSTEAQEIHVLHRVASKRENSARDGVTMSRACNKFHTNSVKHNWREDRTMYRKWSRASSHSSKLKNFFLHDNVFFIISLLRRKWNDICFLFYFISIHIIRMLEYYFNFNFLFSLFFSSSWREKNTIFHLVPGVVSGRHHLSLRNKLLSSCRGIFVK